MPRGIAGAARRSLRRRLRWWERLPADELPVVEAERPDAALPHREVVARAVELHVLIRRQATDQLRDHLPLRACDGRAAGSAKPADQLDRLVLVAWEAPLGQERLLLHRYAERLAERLDGLDTAHVVRRHDLLDAEARQEAHQFLRLVLAFLVERPQGVVVRPFRAAARAAVAEQQHRAGQCRAPREALEHLPVGGARKQLVSIVERQPAHLVDLRARTEATAHRAHRPVVHDLLAGAAAGLLQITDLAQRPPGLDAVAGLLVNFPDRAL